jgi:hypothetical protein
MLAMLEAQRAYFASDEHVRREVAAWADATPTERLAALAEMCANAEHFMALQDATPPPPEWPPDTLALLARLRGR